MNNITFPNPFLHCCFYVVVVVEEVFIRGECAGMTNYQARCVLSYFHDTNLTMDFALEILFRWQK